MSDLSVLERTILEALRARIHERLSAAEAAGASAADFGDPDEVAETMVAALPVSHPFDAVTGPFYDTPGLVKWLGITRQALHHRVKTSQLLACPTQDGHTVIPHGSSPPRAAPSPISPASCGCSTPGPRTRG